MNLPRSDAVGLSLNENVEWRVGGARDRMNVPRNVRWQDLAADTFAVRFRVTHDMSTAGSFVSIDCMDVRLSLFEITAAPTPPPVQFSPKHARFKLSLSFLCAFFLYSVWNVFLLVGNKKIDTSSTNAATDARAHTTAWLAVLCNFFVSSMFKCSWRHGNANKCT